MRVWFEADAHAAIIRMIIPGLEHEITNRSFSYEILMKVSQIPGHTHRSVCVISYLLAATCGPKGHGSGLPLPSRSQIGKYTRNLEVERKEEDTICNAGELAKCHRAAPFKPARVSDVIRDAHGQRIRMGMGHHASHSALLLNSWCPCYTWRG